MKVGIKKYLLIIGGSISLGLGMLGILLPVLPTTPFLLLSAFCYLNSSKRLYDWLIGHKRLGHHILGYMEHKTIDRKVKLGALIFLWISLMISMILINKPIMYLVLSLVGVGVSIHLSMLKSSIEHN